MNERLEKLISLMNEHELDGVAFNPGPSLTYLSGLHFHLMERPTVLLISKTGQAVIVLPELEKGKLTGEAAQFQPFTYGDDPATWAAAFEKAAATMSLTDGRIGVEPTRLRFIALPAYGA